MKSFFRSALAGFVVLAALAGCASRPQLYPNGKYRQSGKEGANKDIDECIHEADLFVESGKGKQIARGAGHGAAVGGVVGAVGGAFSNNILGGALFGGAVGAAAGGASSAFTPDEIKRRYVNQCLHDRGYQVLGWD